MGEGGWGPATETAGNVANQDCHDPGSETQANWTGKENWPARQARAGDILRDPRSERRVGQVNGNLQSVAVDNKGFTGTKRSIRYQVGHFLRRWESMWGTADDSGD